ncbi:dienelactone hydrolase family protein [Acetobacter sp. AN02]|uniref:dienelactone hydrolase family protein n=1 Tax=Acetobacter sp. AN02 TaxID=2894186 RepID=UPI00243440EA|nr:dienelactone hydrolase family protein [Acetobacter sp. AN02]MDG6094754.1 dienelactone hydrolase family protein [Acetobacter sp. AN02]
MTSVRTLTAQDGHSFSLIEAGSPESPHAIVIVQEIFGLTGNMRNICGFLAGQGFHVISPALFDRVTPGQVLGYTPEDVQRGLDLRSQIPLQASIIDLSACAAALNRKKVGILGFCWGGTLAWEAACQTEHFAAAVAWYGGGIAEHLDQMPHCPVQMHFGGQDKSIPHLDITKIREAHPETEIFVYDDAGHGFGNRDRSSWNADASDLAWERSLEFLKKRV